MFFGCQPFFPLNYPLSVSATAGGDVMTEAHLLVVDDDAKVRTLLNRYLSGEGFSVVEAENEPDALQKIENMRFDLVTLDINLGQGDGFEVVRKVRQHSNVPIIMVTGKDDVIDKVVGLELGADDYITKPFHLRELMARVRSVLRRANTASPLGPPDQSTPPDAAHASDLDALAFRFDGMVAIPDRFELIDRNGQHCDLTSGDFKLLTVFLDRPKRILSREQLMDLIGGQNWTPLDRTIDNQVARLRKKIERDPSNPKLIKTVRGIGYSLACEVKHSGDT
jgi:two-component system, OmpR family, response regulator